MKRTMHPCTLPPLISSNSIAGADIGQSKNRTFDVSDITPTAGRPDNIGAALTS